MRTLFQASAWRALAATLISAAALVGISSISAQAQVTGAAQTALAGLQDRYLTVGGSLVMTTDTGMRFGGIHMITTGGNDELQGFAGVGATVAHSQSGIASMRVEAEGRAGNLSPESFMAGSGWTGDVNHYAAMANGYLDLNAPGAGVVYAGLGVGALLIDGTIAQGGTVGNINDWAPAAQAMAGVAFPVAANVGAKVGYRYLESGDFRLRTTTGGTTTQGEMAVRGQHSVEAGLMFKF